MNELESPKKGHPNKSKASWWNPPFRRRLPNTEKFVIRRHRTRRADLMPLTEEQRQLAASYLPLARALAKPLKRLFRHWAHEFESAASLALVEAARSFDPSRNIKFATFARFRIRGALVDVSRKMGLAGWEDAPEEAPSAFSLGPYSEVYGKMVLATHAPPVGTEFEDVESFEHLIKKLPKRHAEVCRMQYLYGKTQSEIAGRLGCSQAEVTRLHLKALELLSEPYDVDGAVNRATWRKRKKSTAAEANLVPARRTPEVETGPESDPAAG